MKRIFVIGAAGQIGSELMDELCARYGRERIVAGYHERALTQEQKGRWLFEPVDCRDFDIIDRIIGYYEIGTIYHLAAMLSARGEQSPLSAWDVNVNGLFPVLEAARKWNCSVFFPSSIGAFGPDTQKYRTPQDALQRPTTVYGISKSSGELLCQYYHLRYGVDTRGLRFPGLVSYNTPPGGGTTDYAVEIFHHALKERKYTCFLQAGTFLDMMYMPDAVRAAVELMEADPACLRNRNAYNVTAMSVDPAMLAERISVHIPGFRIDYQVDPVRQAIADSWPDSLDDNAAREEWNWQPCWSLDAMVRDMLENLSDELRWEDPVVL